MGKKMMLAFILIWTSATVIWAALAPYYQSAKEIKAILENEQVEEALGIFEPIDSIVRTSNGYRISRGGCQLDVEVVYLPQTVPGPAPFELRVGDLNCEG